MGSGIGKVFLQEVREREKHQKWKVSHIDPRNASRCPSAAREPTYRLRYQSPINACKYIYFNEHLVFHKAHITCFILTYNC